MRIDVAELGDASVGYLVFEVAEQAYALLLSSVQEIQRAVAIVPVPRAPPILEGVVNVRGRVIPALSFRVRFGHPARPVDPGDHLILALAGDRLVGVHVDRVREITYVDTASVASAATLSATIDSIAGVLRLKDGLVLIHDLATFLSASESENVAAALTDEREPPGPS